MYSFLNPYRSLTKLQAEELQVHGGELSKVWKQLEEEQYLRNQLLGTKTNLNSKLKANENVSYIQSYNKLEGGQTPLLSVRTWTPLPLGKRN